MNEKKMISVKGYRKGEPTSTRDPFKSFCKIREEDFNNIQ